jgi:hypothetical protein
MVVAAKTRCTVHEIGATICGIMETRRAFVGKLKKNKVVCGRFRYLNKTVGVVWTPYNDTKCTVYVVHRRTNKKMFKLHRTPGRTGSEISTGKIKKTVYYNAPKYNNNPKKKKP